MSQMHNVLRLSLFALSIASAYADQGSFTNSGGSTSGTSGVVVSSSTTNPPGTLTLSCPEVSPTICAGGSFAYSSSGGTATISTTFTTGKFVEGCSGGGKGGHITCSYTFTGYFTGTWTVNGQPQAITGVTYQAFGTGGAGASGTTAFNSSYTPFYYSDSEQILRSDDLQGTNQISYGTGGGGVGNFYGAYGLALDSAGRIYVADTYNCRVVRIDDMKGTNWATYGGTCGSAQGQFYDPSGIGVDPSGKIYIMDTGNSRLVRIDDMTGANWVAMNSVGSGVGQFLSFTASPVFDSAGRIYIADTGNLRIVRMDDMTGANWTVLTQGPPVNGFSPRFVSPTAVALDSAGKIYVADNNYQNSIVRVDDMTGANWTVAYTGTGSGLNSISVDSGGTVMAGGGGVRFVDNMAGVLNSSGSIGPVGSYYVFGITSVPLPTPRPSAISLNPTSMSFSQNYGSTSPPQPLTVTNFGGSTLNIQSVSASGVFAQTSNCLGPLAAGSSCTVNVTFSPAVPGPVSGQISFTDDSGNLGVTQTVPLSGMGTGISASLSPTTLSFDPQPVGTTSESLAATLQNTGIGPIQVSSIVATPPFSQTNNCTGSIAPGATCTIQVFYTPTAIQYDIGTLTVNDNAGSQAASLNGTGTPAANVSPATLTFGTTPEGATSAPMAVTFSNSASRSITFSSIVASAGFGISSNTCGTSVAAGAGCTVGVTFKPTSVGAITGTLTFTDNIGTSPQVVLLSGTGGSPVTLSTTTLGFGAVAVGSTTAVKTVTLTNHGAVALNFTSIAATTGFAVASNTCGTSIAAGSSCIVGVTFTPAAVGAVTGSLTFTDDAVSSPQTVSLTGTGIVPVTLSVTTLSFGTVGVGSTTAAKTVTLTNHETVALNFTSIAATTGFAVTSNTCGTGIAAGAACTVGVTFTPTAVGAVTGALTFTDDASGSPQTVSLSGTGITPVTLSVTTLSFGTVGVGSTTAAKTVTLTNHETVPLNFTSIAASSGFAVAGNTCGTSIAAGAACTVGVTFTPSAIGAVSGALTFTDDAANSPQTVSLTGTGIAPVTLSATAINFGTVGVGSTTAARTVALANHETVPLNFTSIAATAGFAVASNTCGTTIAAGASCVVGVTFTPSAIGVVNGTLTFTDNASSSPQIVSLTGTGIAPVTLTTASLNFGTVGVGSTTAARTVTLTNHETVALNFSGIAATTPFAVAGNTCGTSIAAGASCVVGVTFTPSAIGVVNGTLTFTDDAANNPQTVSLTGTGSAPVTLSATGINFGTVGVGSTTAAKTVTLANHKTAPLNFSSIAATTPFAVAGNTCGTSIAAGATCAVGVTFTPSAVGLVTGTLTFTDDAANNPQAVSLTGTGSAPVTLSATALNFGTVALGTTSAAKTVTLANHATVALSFTSIAATAGFAIASNTCGTSIAAGATCTIGITFTPASAGAASGSLTFTDTATDSPQTLSLAGTGS